MDWLKRNWVDVLMAGLILAVVGGFLTLLLRGGVFKPNTNANTTSTNTVTTVPAPTTPKPVPSSQPTITPSSQPTTPSSQSVTPKPTPKPTTITTPRTTTPLGVPEIPEAPVVAEKPIVSTKNTANTTNTDTPNTTNTDTANTTNNVASSRPTVKPPANTSSQTPAPINQPLKTIGTYTRADFLRNYRVATGSYTNLERAKKAVAQLRSLGLPAQTFPSGNTHVVVVGPYAREASARTAFSKVKQTFPDAILYRPDGTKEASARVNPTPKPTIVPQGGGNGQPTTLDSAYLQVGAFKDIKGATALLTKLKNAGFAPLTKNISGLLRVLVGPIQTNQIQTIRTDLKNQGFEAFQVNL